MLPFFFSFFLLDCGLYSASKREMGQVAAANKKRAMSVVSDAVWFRRFRVIRPISRLSCSIALCSVLSLVFSFPRGEYHEDLSAVVRSGRPVVCV